MLVWRNISLTLNHKIDQKITASDNLRIIFLKLPLAVQLIYAV